MDIHKKYIVDLTNITKRGNFERGVLKIVLVYAFVSALYIWLSDYLVSLAFKDIETLTMVSMIKGWLFVGFTTLLLYVLVKRLLNKVLESQKSESVAQEYFKKSEASYRSLTEQIPAIIYRSNMNESSSTVYVSPRIETLGYTVDEWLNSPDIWMNMIHPDDKQHVISTLSHAHQNNIGFSCEYRLQTKNGEWKSFHDEARILIDTVNNTSYLQGVMLDITERKVLESQMRKLSQAVEQSPVNTIITNLKGEIEYVNKAFELNSGYTFEEVLGKKPKIHTSGKTPKSTIEGMWNSIIQGKTWRGSFINRHKDGTEYIERAVVAPVRDENGSVTHYLSVQQDITLQTKAEEDAHRLAHFDTLTKLPNRNLLIQNLEQHLSSAREHPHRDVLILLNIDHFKNLNDARGHRFGDDVLISVTERLNDLQLEDVFIARYGGDEFAILLHNLNLNITEANHHAAALVSKVHNIIRQPFYIQGAQIYITASLGITLFPEKEDEDAFAVLRHADTALHLAKENGGNQTVFFESPMTQAVEKYFQIERDLHHALANSELRLYLQSQVNSKGKVAGAEALVRWQHPEHGLVSPVTFIPVAEDSDLITQIDQWVFKEVCKLLTSVEMAHFTHRISVNISPRSFRQPTFLDWITQALAETKVDGSMITLEVTEGVVLNNIEEVISKMKSLTALGIHFSIDDFGTGYSSLSYLKQLPIHELKIDKAFVQDAPTNQSDAALVEAIIAVAQKMHLRVVAEGVETAIQAEFLNAKYQVIHQGYLFSKPVPSAMWLKETYG